MRRAPPRRRRAALALAALAALLGAAVPAWAATNGDGDLRASFRGGISPSKLPRQRAAPVAVRVAGDLSSASGESGRLPQLRQIRVAINRQGKLFDRGLPVCRARQIQPTRERNARRICGDAIVGGGSVVVEARLPDQAPFKVKAKLLAFNGPRQNGKKLILAQAYAENPPGAFVLTFRVERRKGTYGTVLTTTLPPETRQWAYLTHFDLKLHRTYRYKGKQRSYVSAACSAPSGFSSALFPFARATYSFANGQRLTVAQSDFCRVAG